MGTHLFPRSCQFRFLVAVKQNIDRFLLCDALSAHASLGIDLDSCRDLGMALVQMTNPARIECLLEPNYEST